MRSLEAESAIREMQVLSCILYIPCLKPAQVADEAGPPAFQSAIQTFPLSMIPGILLDSQPPQPGSTPNSIYFHFHSMAWFPELPEL